MSLAPLSQPALVCGIDITERWPFLVSVVYNWPCNTNLTLWVHRAAYQNGLLYVQVLMDSQKGVCNVMGASVTKRKQRDRGHVSYQWSCGQGHGGRWPMVMQRFPRKDCLCLCHSLVSDLAVHSPIRGCSPPFIVLHLSVTKCLTRWPIYLYVGTALLQWMVAYSGIYLNRIN